MELSLDQLLNAADGLNLSYQAKQVSVQPLMKRSSTQKSIVQNAKVALKIFKKDQEKWIKPVSKNRNKVQRDFRKERPPEQTIANAIQSQQTSQLQKSLKLQRREDLQKIERECQRKVQDLQKQKLLRQERDKVFFQQLKNKRIAKIKSKLYHKIKNKKKERDRAKLLGDLGQEAKLQELQRLRAQRIEQRITLRHSKNTHRQRLLRFAKNQNKQIQQQLNEMDQRKREFLEKVDVPIQAADLNQQQVQKILEQELQALEKMQKQAGSDGLEFMRRAKLSSIQQQRRQTKQLLEYLNNENQQEQQIVKPQSSAKGQVAKESNKKSFRKQLIAKSTRDTLGQLTAGIDLKGLKEKYRKEAQQVDVQKYVKENQTLFQNHKIITDNQNELKFAKQKHDELQQEVPKSSFMRGWGSWAGPTIKPKLSVEEQLNIKMKEIDKLKKNRKDGQLKRVIIEEKRDKKYGQMLVKQLPEGFVSAEHFNFLQEGVLGPQFNSHKAYIQSTKPKILSRKGESIAPIRLEE